MSIGATHGAISEIKHKIYKKSKITIRKGVNDFMKVDIDKSRIVSISGAVNYTNAYIMPLSYPMINYGNGGYTEWGLAAIIKGSWLQIISGADWNNCDVNIVVSYV